MLHRFKALIFLGLIFTSNPVFTAPELRINTRYYPVYGTEALSIRNSIERQGPTGNDGRRYHASTKWKVDWNYRWIESSNHCRLTGVEVRINIDYRLPQLKQLASLTTALQQQWNNYFDALYRHEQRHKDIGILAAQELEKALLDTAPRSCFALQNHLTDKAQTVLDKYERLEKDFDIETDHGAKQGITLP